MNKNTSLTDWLTYIEQAHTKEIDMGLSRTKDLVNRLKIDFSNQCVVTVGGTNGKGTTCALIEQICLRAGLSVGVYSSPHLVSFCERIRLNGEMIDDAQLCDIFSQIDTARAASSDTPIALTYFEFATLAGLKAFSDKNVDVLILEVGLGGRLDAVNVIDTDVAVITSIGLDHQDWLGDTKEKIALEKAGIFRANKPAIIAEPAPQNSMLNYAQDIGAHVSLLGRDFVFDEANDIAHLHGYSFSTQHAKIPKQNVATALAAVHAIQPALLARDDIQALIDQTQVMGRHHVLREQAQDKHCAVILDVAHNEDSAQQLSKLIRTYPFETCHIVVGMLKDKNIEVSLQAFANLNAHWYCSSLPTARGEKAERLVKALNNSHSEHSEYALKASIDSFDSVHLAYDKALVNAQCNDIILVMGSFLTVAAVLNYEASA